MKAAAGREGEMPTTIALENTAQNPQERKKKKNILSEIEDDQSNTEELQQLHASK